MDTRRGDGGKAAGTAVSHPRASTRSASGRTGAHIEVSSIAAVLPD